MRLPGLRANGNFSRQRYAASAQWQDSRLTLRGEYLWGRDADARSDGGYITARVGDIGLRGLDAVGSVDHLRAIEATVNRWQLGLQYWFYPKCRVQAAYSRTHFCGGISGNAILTQVQVAF